VTSTAASFDQYLVCFAASYSDQQSEHSSHQLVGGSSSFGFGLLESLVISSQCLSGGMVIPCGALFYVW